MMRLMRFLLAPSLLALAFGPMLAFAQAADPGDVAIEATKEHITFLIGKDLVGKYNIAAGASKPHFWSLHGPGNVQITRPVPMTKDGPGKTPDHPHHKSLWFGHGDVIPHGIQLKVKSTDKRVTGVDFWSEAKGHGVVVCTEVGSPKLEKNHGQVTTKNAWQAPDGAKIMDETRTIHLYDFGAAWLLIFDIDLFASVAPITFGDTEEGSFAVRINDAIREDGGKGKLVNAEGVVGAGRFWGKQSPWCDYSGPIDGKNVGLAIFDDPANSTKICWHVRGYGLHGSQSVRPSQCLQRHIPSEGESQVCRAG